ncbi:hypothetical protein [Streptomyces platensis]|uniref:hypothetical protein n=1 Tax=Streptomyces platensis TaxID=58346 RepID=UPI00367E55FE
MTDFGSGGDEERHDGGFGGHSCGGSAGPRGPAARDLESFLTKVALYVTGLRTRNTLPPVNSEQWEIPYWALGALSEVDEAGGEQPAWSYVLHNS